MENRKSTSFSKKTREKVKIVAKKMKEFSKKIKNDETLYITSKNGYITVGIHKGGFYINRINTFPLPRIEDFEKIVIEKIEEELFLKLYELIIDPEIDLTII